MNKPSICSQTRDRNLGRSCSGQYGPWFQAILKIKKCCVLCCLLRRLKMSRLPLLTCVTSCGDQSTPMHYHYHTMQGHEHPFILIYIWCENQGRFDPYPYWFFAPGPHPVKRRFSIRATWCNQSHLENPRSKWDLVKRPQSILGTMKWQDQQAIKQQTTRTNMILCIYTYIYIYIYEYIYYCDIKWY